MAPRIGRHRGEPDPAAPRPAAAELAGQLRTLRKAIEDHCDYVGDRFAEEARKAALSMVEQMRAIPGSFGA